MSFNVQRRWALLFLTAAGATLCLLAILVSARGPLQFDTTVRSAVHASAAPYWTLVATILSFLGRMLVLIPATAAIAAYLMYKGRRFAGFAYLMTMGGAVAVNWALKDEVQRSRPQPFYGVDPDSFSFPSGHVFFSFCFCSAMILILFRRSKRSVAVCFAYVLAVAWSRVYMGVHYPTDVIAGFVAGICWIAALFGLGLFTSERMAR